MDTDHSRHKSKSENTRPRSRRPKQSAPDLVHVPHVVKRSEADSLRAIETAAAVARRTGSGEMRRAAPERAAFDLQRALAAWKPATYSPEEIAEQQAALQLNLRHRGIGRRYRDVDLTKIEPWLPSGYRRLADRLLHLLKEPMTLAIGGPRGVGKTALTCGLVRAFAEHDRYGFIATAQGYVEGIKNTPYDRRASRVEKFSRAHLVVLDEIQERSPEPWGNSIFVQLIDARYANELSTILLTNLEMEGFYDFVGDSVRRRVQESGGYIETGWPMIETLRPPASAGGEADHM